MQKSYSVLILVFVAFISCKNKSETPLEFSNVEIGNITSELGKSGYYIKTTEDFQVTPDSTLEDKDVYRFFRKDNIHRYFGVIVLQKMQHKFESDPYLDDMRPIKTVQSIVLGKVQTWKIYNTGVMGYLSSIDGNISCMVRAPEMKSLDTLIAIVSSIARH